MVGLTHCLSAVLRAQSRTDRQERFCSQQVWCVIGDLVVASRNTVCDHQNTRISDCIRRFRFTRRPSIHGSSDHHRQVDVYLRSRHFTLRSWVPCPLLTFNSFTNIALAGPHLVYHFYHQLVILCGTSINRHQLLSELAPLRSRSTSSVLWKREALLDSSD